MARVQKTHPAFTPPKQSRSRATLRRLSVATLEILEERGMEGLTVGSIVERAGVSVGSFYARFAGKEELIRYVRAQIWSEARRKWDAALRTQVWEGLPTSAVVEGVVGLLLRTFRADHLQRRVLGREVGADPETAAQLMAFHDHLLTTVTPLLLSHKEDLTHPDPEEAIAFGYRCIVGAIREFLEIEEAKALTLGEGDSLRSRDDLGQELAFLWLGYLRPRERDPAQEDEGAVDFFDPWG